MPAGQEGKILERKNLADPEDLRVLARVLDLQRTLVHRKRAIEILETLADKNLATSEDRFSVARLYEAIGEWQKAREKYRELNLRTRNSPGYGDFQSSTFLHRSVCEQPSSTLQSWRYARLGRGSRACRGAEAASASGAWDTGPPSEDLSDPQ